MPPAHTKWLVPPRDGAPTPMALLVQWLQLHYTAYRDSWGLRSAMLCELLLEMEKAGVRNCSVPILQNKIRRLKEQLRGKQTASADFSLYKNQLRGILNTQAQMVTLKHWIVPSRTGGPAAMTLMVNWLQRNLRQFREAGRSQEEMLRALGKEIQSGGYVHFSVTIVRSRFYDLRRKIRSKKALPQVLRQYEDALQTIFAVEHESSEIGEDDKGHDADTSPHVPVRDTRSSGRISEIRPSSFVRETRSNARNSLAEDQSSDTDTTSFQEIYFESRSESEVGASCDETDNIRLVESEEITLDTEEANKSNHPVG